MRMTFITPSSHHVVHTSNFPETRSRRESDDEIRDFTGFVVHQCKDEDEGEPSSKLESRQVL